MVTTSLGDLAGGTLRMGYTDYSVDVGRIDRVMDAIAGVIA